MPEMDYWRAHHLSTRQAQKEEKGHAMNCGDCVHAYDSADNKLRCRIHPRALVCNQAMFDDCKLFERDPGSDSVDSSRVWYCDYPGRGD